MNSLQTTPPDNQQDLIVCRYGSRYWAVCQGDELIAVTLYKKGARRVVQLLATTPKNPTQTH